MSTRAIFQAHVDDVLLESIPIEVQWVMQTPVTGTVYQVQRTTMASGDNSFVVPTSARLLILIPPPTVTYAKIWKGAGGDTGVTFDRYLAMIFPVLAPQTIIINSGGLETAPHTLIYVSG